MARIRYLKPEFFTDEELAKYPPETRLTYAGLWCYADKSGRLEDRPKFLKAMIFPYDDIDIEGHLNLLCQHKSNGRPFIVRYHHEHLSLIQILNWDKHQKPHHTEKESLFPAPPHTPPYNIKENIKIKGMENQLEASATLRNGLITVKQRLKKRKRYECEFFQEFWVAYPRKENKGDAWKAWCALGTEVSRKTTDQMKLVITKYKNHPQWMKQNGEFIPYPSTWINGRRWEDEIKTQEELDDARFRNLQ